MKIFEELIKRAATIFVTSEVTIPTTIPASLPKSLPFLSLSFSSFDLRERERE
jgi:hypothetical protein